MQQVSSNQHPSVSVIIFPTYALVSPYHKAQAQAQAQARNHAFYRKLVPLEVPELVALPSGTRCLALALTQTLVAPTSFIPVVGLAVLLLPLILLLLPLLLLLLLPLLPLLLLLRPNESFLLASTCC